MEGDGHKARPLAFWGCFAKRSKWYSEWQMVWYNTIMNATLSIDRAGRLVLPKPVRQQLQIEPGESLEMESFDDHIVLRPVRATATAYKKRGIWVFRTGPLKASVVDETIRRVRKERERQILGTKR
jgi:AbrB family looped-hinge helix DNA binding protein